MDVYSLDFETSSFADIKDVGAYRYNNDPSTVVLWFAIAKNDGPVLLWDYDDPGAIESEEALDLMREASVTTGIIRAFNVSFEVSCWRYVATRQLGIPEPSLDVWRCTQAMCNRAAIRVSLGEATADVGMPGAKDKMGKKFIEIFSNRTVAVTLEPPDGMKDPETIRTLVSGKQTAGRKPKNRKSFSPIHDEEILWDWFVKVDGERMTVRRAWQLFGEYCRQDVVAESMLAEKLSRFELAGDELASFQFDLRLNYKGVPVNQEALVNAQKLVDQFTGRIGTRFENLTGLKPTQGRKFLPWLQDRGYPADNLQADTVEEILESPDNLSPEALEGLKMHALLNFAALKKIPKMLGAACDDGYVRGTTRWHGARTGRDTGQIIQPHNAKISTIGNESMEAYGMICEGRGLEDFDMFWSSPLEVVASCVRHFIEWPGGSLLDCDYVGVEARIGPWLCGQQDKLDSILAGLDQYKVMASEVAFDIPYSQVTKPQRQIGKVVELQCIYGAGGRGLRDSLRAMGIEKTLKECNKIVRKFRERFPKYPECWREMEDAAKVAILEGKVTHVAGGRLAFGRLKTAGIVYLVMRLPSGRRMYYPHPEVKRQFRRYDEEEMVEEPWKREEVGYWSDSISFYGKQPGSHFWGRVYTWGSRLFENACQAIGADLLKFGCITAEKAGYDLRLLIHDQILALAHEGKTLEGLLEAFCTKQPWAESFPLEADGAVVPYYLKES